MILCIIVYWYFCFVSFYWFSFVDLGMPKYVVYFVEEIKFCLWPVGWRLVPAWGRPDPTARARIQPPAAHDQIQLRVATFGHLHAGSGQGVALHLASF